MASFGKDLEEERAQQCNCYERSRERCGQRDSRCKGPAVGGSPACWRLRQEPRGWNTANRRAEESVYEGVRTFVFSVLDFLLGTLTSSLRCQSLISRPDSVIVMRISIMASSKGRAFGHSHVMDDVDLPFRFLESLENFT